MTHAIPKVATALAAVVILFVPAATVPPARAPVPAGPGVTPAELDTKRHDDACRCGER